MLTDYQISKDRPGISLARPFRISKPDN